MVAFFLFKIFVLNPIQTKNSKLHTVFYLLISWEVSLKLKALQVLVNNLELLNSSPKNYPLNELTSTEETKLRYRFLDLRTERMQRALRSFSPLLFLKQLLHLR